MNRSLLLLVLFVSSSLAAHAVLRSRDVIFRKSSLNTLNAPAFHEDHAHIARSSRHPASQVHQYLVHVARPLSNDEHAAIEAHIGMSLGQYLPHNTFHLVATEDVARLAAKAPQVQWVGSFPSEHKIVEGMKHDQDRLDVVLADLPQNPRTQETTQRLADIMQKEMGIDAIFEAHTNKIRITLANKDESSFAVQWLSEHPEVHFIEPTPEYHPYNLFASQTIQTNGNVPLGSSSATPYTNTSDLGLGSDQIIGLADSGIQQSSCYFSATGKILRYVSTNGDTTDASGHGTSVASTIAGSNGIVPTARLYFVDIQSGTGPLTPPTPISSMFTPAMTDGVRIFALPFGSSASYYGDDARSIDEFTSANPNFLVIAAAGNTERNLSNLAQSKNALVVGGSQSIRAGVAQGYSNAISANEFASHPALFGSQVLANFSSRGPTSDGRIKPDVVAPSMWIKTAALGTCATGLVKGTSYATGVAAAAAGIVRSYMAAGFYDLGEPNEDSPVYPNPSSALVKAILINGAQPLAITDVTGNSTFQGLEYPSGDQGFGRIQLNSNLYTTAFSTNNQKLLLVDSATISGNLGVGESYVRCMNTTGSGEVTATLVWNDLPGSITSGHLLVNDLDLVVIDQFGTEKRTMTAGGDFDSLNNVEHIKFNSGSFHGYAVHVYARVIPGLNAKQAFALAISGPVAFTDCVNFQPEFSAISRICPNSCSNFGTCLTSGKCSCTAGHSGVDCSLTPCPSNADGPCSGNGYCDGATSTCVCGLNFSPPDCRAPFIPVVEVAQNNTLIVPVESPQEISKGLLAGLVIAAFFIGGVLFLIVGLCVAVRYLEYKRDKAMAERAARDEEMN